MRTQTLDLDRILRKQDQGFNMTTLNYSCSSPFQSTLGLIHSVSCLSMLQVHENPAAIVEVDKRANRNQLSEQKSLLAWVHHTMCLPNLVLQLAKSPLLYYDRAATRIQ